MTNKELIAVSAARRKLSSTAVRLRSFESLVEHDLADLTDLAELSEDVLRKERHALERRCEHECERKTDQSEKEYVIGWYAPDFQQLQDVFPQILRSSLFTTIMMLLESHLKTLCLDVEKTLGISVKFMAYKKSSAKDIVSAALDYLQDYGQLTLKKLANSDREFIVMAWRLRTCIVHSRGKVSGKYSDDLRKYFKRIRSVGVKGRGPIILKDNFLSIMIHKISQFMDQLLRAYIVRLRITEKL